MMLQSLYPAHAPPCEIATKLSDGRAICLRTIRPSDEARIREGITEMSDRSRYLRFFSTFREPPESVVKRLSAVDGHDHIGWGAILLDGIENPPIAAAHAIRLKDDDTRGELAIAVLDEYQCVGLARTLIAAVLLDCRNEDIIDLEMQVMGENGAATALVTSLGAKRKPALDSVTHFVLNVADALARMRKSPQPPGVMDVLHIIP